MMTFFSGSHRHQMYKISVRRVSFIWKYDLFAERSENLGWGLADLFVKFFYSSFQILETARWEDKVFLVIRYQFGKKLWPFLKSWSLLGVNFEDNQVFVWKKCPLRFLNLFVRIKNCSARYMNPFVFKFDDLRK